MMKRHYARGVLSSRKTDSATPERDRGICAYARVALEPCR
jgi:hypothetical protein